MAQAVELHGRRRRAGPPCCSWARAGRARSWSRARSTPGATARRRAVRRHQLRGLSRELLESELFGHEKGAFTGAHGSKRAGSSWRTGGTLFLDEVGRHLARDADEAPARSSRSGSSSAVGGTRPIPSTCGSSRRPTATRDRPSRRRFREDLYYRLNVVPITCRRSGPARGHPRSSPGSSWIASPGRRRRPSRRSRPRARGAQLLAYAWPGNVRELANVIERAVVLPRPGDHAARSAAARGGRAAGPGGGEAGSYQAAVQRLPSLADRDGARQHRRQSCRGRRRPRPQPHAPPQAHPSARDRVTQVRDSWRRGSATLGAASLRPDGSGALRFPAFFRALRRTRRQVPA